AAHRRKRGGDRNTVRPPHSRGKCLVSVRTVGKVDGVVPGAGRRRKAHGGIHGWPVRLPFGLSAPGLRCHPIDRTSAELLAMALPSRGYTGRVFAARRNTG